MERDAERGVDWVHLPVIATMARLLCRELTLQNQYLLLENRTFKSKIPGRLRFTDEERRCLSEAALAMGRSLMREVVSIVKPETILAWQQRLEQQKWDYSAQRTRGPGRPRTPDDIEALVCRLARENLWGYQRLRGELLKLRITLSKGCIADTLEDRRAFLLVREDLAGVRVRVGLAADGAGFGLRRRPRLCRLRFARYCVRGSAIGRASAFRY